MITEDTRAIVTNHTWGHPVDVSAIQDICRNNNLAWIENSTPERTENKSSPIPCTGPMKSLPDSPCFVVITSLHATTDPLFRQITRVQPDGMFEKVKSNITKASAPGLNVKVNHVYCERA